MNSKKWFQKSLRRLLVDMHIPDWDERFLKDFSPENYGEMMALAKVDTAILYTGSCLGLCYFPTKVGFPHRNLHGRDFVREVIDSCGKRGVQTQLYLNVWSRAAYEAHPEWRMIFYDGKGSVEHRRNRFGLCCLNTGFREYFLALLGELADRYETCGYWIDMIGFYGYCHCPACQERFRKESGFLQIPARVDWNDPAFLAYIKCRSRWLDEFAVAISDRVKKKYPQRSVTLQTASIGYGRSSGLGEGFFRSSDFLAGDFTGDSTEQSSICKLFHTLSKNRPIEFMTPRCEDLGHHTASRSYSNLRMRSCAAIANQASFTLIDAIDPVGTLDRRFYEMAGRLNDSYARYEKYISGNSEPVMDIAIFWSLESLIEPFQVQTMDEDDKNAPWNFNFTRNNLAGTLQQHHLLFGFTRGKTLEELRKYPLVILPSASSLTDKECEVLEAYVAQGGRLYVSGATSLWDPEKGMREDFALAKVLGVHTKGNWTQKISYITPVSPEILPGVTKEYPLMLNGAQLLVEKDPDTEVLGYLTLPISTKEELDHFGSAISNPPMIPTKYPALCRHSYGRGEVIYCAGELEEHKLNFHKEIFGSLLKSFLGKSVIETNAPSFVELTLFEDPERKCFLLSCLNLPKDLPPTPVRDLFFRIRIPGGKKVERVLLAPEESPAAFRMEEEGKVLVLEPEELADFALYLLEYS